MIEIPAGFRLSKTSKTGGCAAKIGPGRLGDLVARLVAEAGAGAASADREVLLGPETGDDAGVFRLGDRKLIGTLDFIPPVCDDPHRFGRIAAANALSDVWAMGGEPLFGLNICAFPEDLPPGVAEGILAGGLEALAGGGAALLGGHSIRDRELKYGMAVIGVAGERLLSNSGARPGDRLLLTKALGSGVLVNAHKADRIGDDALEPALVEMSRLNRKAAELALEHSANAATDVTGFGLMVHAWNLARESGVRIEIDFDALPVLPGFYDLVRAGVSTGCTPLNREHATPHVEFRRELAPEQLELLFDPQTSGPLLLCLPPETADSCLEALLASGHRAATIGRVVEAPPILSVG